MQVFSISLWPMLEVNNRFSPINIIVLPPSYTKLAELHPSVIQILSYIIISPVVCTQGSCTIPVPFLSVVRWLCSNIFSIFIKPASVSPDVKFGNDENFAIHSSTWQSGTTDAKGKWCVSIWLAIWNTRENIIVLFQVCDGFSQAENPCMTLQFIW